MVWRQQYHPMDDCLADKNAIERISVQVGQKRDVQYRLLIESQDFSPELLAMLMEEPIRTVRQSQLPNRILDRDLPIGRDADVDLIIFV
jgi:hypothetical protein